MNIASKLNLVAPEDESMASSKRIPLSGATDHFRQSNPFTQS
jgi:hypothetical protein